MDSSTILRMITGRLQMMITTRKISNAITINRLIHFVQQLPLIGKYVPDNLYGLYGVKTIFVIVSNLSRMTKRLFMKALYLGFLIATTYFLQSLLVPESSSNGVLNIEVLMTIFFFFSFIGAPIMFSKGINMDLETDLMIVDRLHADAGKYVPARIYERKLVDFFATLPLAVFLSIHPEYSILESMIIVPLMIAAKIIIEAIELASYALLRRLPKTKLKYLFFVFFPLSTMAFSAPFLLLFNRIPFSFKAVVFHPLFIIGLLIGAILSLVYIEKYRHYREIAWTSVVNYNLMLDKQKEVKTKGQFESSTDFDKKLKIEEIRTDRFSHLRGYAYFNSIFFHRHKKFFTRRILWRSTISAVTFLTVLIVLLASANMAANDMFAEIVKEIPTRILPMCFFFAYVMSMGRVATSAMFTNCDSAMLHYAFYRLPSVVIPNFYQRFKTILGYNLPTYAIIGSLAILVDLFSQAILHRSLSFVDWHLLPLYIVTLSMIWLFFSFHDLFIYYILQPYSSEFAIKSKLFGFVQTAVWILSYMNLRLSNVNIYLYMIILVLATGTYIAAGLLLINRFCEKTFHLK